MQVLRVIMVVCDASFIDRIALLLNVPSFSYSIGMRWRSSGAARAERVRRIPSAGRRPGTFERAAVGNGTDPA